MMCKAVRHAVFAIAQGVLSCFAHILYGHPLYAKLLAGKKICCMRNRKIILFTQN